MFVGGYILSNQRFYLPAWVPVLGTDFFELKAEFATAQSVTPGQGQTVQIAGVSVGEIKKVELDGRPRGRDDGGPPEARGHDQAGRDHAPATEDRPQGHGRSRWTRARRRCRRSRRASRSRSRRREPDVNLDEILASLDRDTRDYLRLLIAGGGEGLKNNGRNFANAFRRFEPLNRDVAKLTGELTQAAQEPRRA